jgi:hypothetical protein
MDTIFQYIFYFDVTEFYRVLNSQFMSSVLGALAGAAVGALTAQKIALKSKDKEALENQIRAINITISCSFLICNSALAMKKQHIDSLYKVFQSDREKYEKCLKNPPQGQVVNFQTDLKTLHMPNLPIGVLEDTVYNKITIKGRPLALVPTLSNSVSALKSSLDYRSELIGNFKIMFPSISQKEGLDYYFGFPLPDGSVHQEYSDIVDAVYHYLDDVIFYSGKLCEDFNSHGSELRDIYVRRYGKKIENITKFDFGTPEAVAIWPDEQRYESWLSMFLEPEAEQPWHKKLISTLNRVRVKMQ